MLNTLLDKIYTNNIQLTLHHKNIKIEYKMDQNIEKIKQEIKQHKRKIVKRLTENQKAADKGFFIYGHGDLYEYRYGFHSYLYMERHDNELVSIYRLKYQKGSSVPYKTTVMRKNCSFERGFDRAAGFIDWVEERRN
ncbi:hypothetical protein [Gracilibacillus xinjiangensis]|uniref:Uncharacterized protein n=1 Tax=Gracilibacillus xinjiangensis TaxID=1193282 RepID=A0ABV8WWJ8_9BACI